MHRVPILASLVGSFVVAGSLAVAGSADDPISTRVGPPSPTKAVTPVPFAEQEAAAMTLVRQHLPELLAVLEPLKTSKPAEYRKAIDEIAAEARTLAGLQARNPARAALALDAWKTRRHVELVAAQLAQTPTPERSSELHAAIEARVAVDVRRHQFEADQAEAALVRARENLARAEANRDRTRDALSRIEQNRSNRVEARFQALQPKKIAPPTTKPGAAAPRTPAPMPPMPMSTTSFQAGPLPSPESLAEGEPR